MVTVTGRGSHPRDEVLLIYQIQVAVFLVRTPNLISSIGFWKRSQYIFVMRCSDIFLHRACLINQSINSILLGFQKTIHPISMYLVTRKPITLPETSTWKSLENDMFFWDFAYFQGHLPSVPGRATHPPKGSAACFSLSNFSRSSKISTDIPWSLETNWFLKGRCLGKKMEDDLLICFWGKIFKGKCLKDFP